MNTLQKWTEQRWGGRAHLLSPITLRNVHETESAAILRNASVGGAFIETATNPALFSRVDVQLAAEADRIEARVVRADENGVGVEWLEPASAAVLAILSKPRQPARVVPRWLSLVAPWAAP